MTVTLAFPRPAVRHGWHRILPVLLLCWAATSLPGQVREQPPAEVIASFSEYWHQDARERERPIRMTLDVAYYDPAWGNLWGQRGDEVGFLKVPVSLPIR